MRISQHRTEKTQTGGVHRPLDVPGAPPAHGLPTRAERGAASHAKVFGAAAVEASYDVPGAAGAGNGCDVPCAAGVGFGDVPGRDGTVMGDHIAPSRAGAGCRSSLEIWHPVVLAVYFAGTVAIAMFGMHPGCVGISLVGGLALCSLLAGVRSSLAKLRWQLPLLLLVCVVNPLYSALGSTLLARVGPFRIYAESLAYGGMMGALFVSVLLWFEAASLVLGSDELLELAGAHLPHVALALSMVLRLIPLMLRRIRQAHDALGATRGQRGGVREATRLLGALLTWSLEDSVERADSMRARGWGAVPQRTSYRVRKMHRRDVVALVVVAGLVALAAAGVARTLAGWRFYPRMQGTTPLWLLAPYALLVALPVAAVATER